MNTSDQYLDGVLTFVVSTGDSFDVNWQVPIGNGTFDGVASSVLKHITALAASHGQTLRNLLAERVFDAYITYASCPDDPADLVNIEADNQLKIFLKLFAIHAGSPTFTFVVENNRIIDIKVGPPLTPKDEARFMLLEDTKAGSRL